MKNLQAAALPNMVQLYSGCANYDAVLECGISAQLGERANSLNGDVMSGWRPFGKVILGEFLSVAG
jgi:hypothetical protein